MSNSVFFTSQGFRGDESIGEVARKCATRNKEVKDAPDPLTAGWKEQLQEQGLESDEEDLSDLDSQEFEDTDSEGSVEDMLDDPDFYAILQETGDVEAHTGVKKEKLSIADEDARDMKVLNRGLLLLNKAARLQQAGLARIRAVAKKSKNPAAFAHLMSPFQQLAVPAVTPASLIPAAPVIRTLSHLPQVFGETVRPKKIVLQTGTELWGCPACPEMEPVTWPRCDAHIRQFHTKIMYGPCDKCSFTCWNQDTWRGHRNRAHKKTGEEAGAPSAAAGAPSSVEEEEGVQEEVE